MIKGLKPIIGKPKMVKRKLHIVVDDSEGNEFGLKVPSPPHPRASQKSGWKPSAGPVSGTRKRSTNRAFRNRT